MCFFSIPHFSTKLIFKNIDFCNHSELKYAVAVHKLSTVLSGGYHLSWSSPILKSFTFLVAAFYFLSYKS